MAQKIENSQSSLTSIPDTEEMAWIGSLLALGALFGKLIMILYFIFIICIII